MSYYDVMNLVIATKTNIIDDMLGGNGIQSTTSVRIQYEVSSGDCAQMVAALGGSERPVERSQPLQHLTISIVKSHNILFQPPA
jgi:hypothetical protein